MTNQKPENPRENRGKKISLAPLTPEQALFKALNTPPPKSEKKPAKRKPAK